MYNYKCSRSAKFKIFLIDVKFLINRFFTDIGVLSILKMTKNKIINTIKNIINDI